MVVLTAHLFQRLVLLDGELPVPQGPGHVGLFRVPRRRFAHPAFPVVVVIGRDLLHQSGYLGVLLGKYLPSTAKTYLQRPGKVGVRPVPDALEGAIAQVIAMLPVYLRYLACKQKGFQHGQPTLETVPSAIIFRNTVSLANTALEVTMAPAGAVPVLKTTALVGSVVPKAVSAPM